MTGDGGLGFALSAATQAWRATVADALRPYDVTPAQFFVLVATLRAGGGSTQPPTQREVGDTVKMDANTVSQVLRSLETRGLLRRDRHPANSRAIALELTDEGRETVRACGKVVRAVNDTFFANVDRETLNALLRQLF